MKKTDDVVEKEILRTKIRTKQQRHRYKSTEHAQTSRGAKEKRKEVAHTQRGERLPVSAASKAPVGSSPERRKFAKEGWASIHSKHSNTAENFADAENRRSKETRTHINKTEDTHTHRGWSREP